MDNNSNKEQIVIALDAMGGDNAPDAVIKGANIIATESNHNVYFKIYGNKEKIIPLLNKCPSLINSSELIHTDQIVDNNEIPSQAIRNCKKSSMQLAINSVKEKESHAVVSAGNTGALMAMSTITLRTLSQIHRPAIVACLPTTKGKVVLLDLGANVESDANNLYQFAIMGDAFAKVLLHKNKPKIGLLNIGSEESKGKDSIKLANTLLQDTDAPINYHGYIEGNEIPNGEIDVVVTDGFTGNVTLKSIEGYAKVFVHFTKKSFSSSIFSKMHYLISKSTLKKLTKSLDNRLYNGAMLIGLNGIVVKSHGSMDEVGIANAIKTAYELSKFRVNEKIAEELSQANNMESA